MTKFVGFTTNGEYSVGCTGQTVFLLDKNHNVLKKFKDMVYAYKPAIAPNGSFFVVKSTGGCLAVYSLETFSLLKKFRFSKVDGSQDDGFCFSPDSRFFINIERQNDSLQCAVSTYRTSDFSLVDQILFDKDMMISEIECEENTCFVLGFVRNSQGIMDHGFVAKFENSRVQNELALKDDEYHFYSAYKSLERFGFTEKQYAWMYIDCELEKLKTMNLTLAKLYAQKQEAMQQL